MSDKDVLELVKNWKQWRFGGPSTPTPLMPQPSFKENSETNYTLSNTQNGKFVQWDDRTGFNAKFSDDNKPETAKKVRRWFITRQGSATGPIKYGERIAIGNGKKPSYVKHEQMTFGVDLQWKDDPAFEWKILGGKVGEPVKTGDLVAIFNEKSAEGKGECLIYFHRDVGISLGWPTSTDWKDRLTEAAFDYAKSRAVTYLTGGIL